MPSLFPLSLSPLDIVIISVVILAALKKPAASLFEKLISGSADRHSLHSEVHGILEASARSAGSLAQIRDVITNPSDQATTLHEIRGLLEADQKHKMSVNLTDATAAALIDIAKQQLEATKKLDDRLFEFVNSTKRIMRAMEGGADGDDDTLVEEAKAVKARAADHGVDITLEDAIKRVREQATFRR